MYNIVFSPTALLDVAKLKKSEPTCFNKLGKIISELKEHPTVGTGHPEPLKGLGGDIWSRRLNRKHRLVYKIEADNVLVYILSSYGHYSDK